MFFHNEIFPNANLFVGCFLSCPQVLGLWPQPLLQSYTISLIRIVWKIVYPLTWMTMKAYDVGLLFA